MANVFHTEECEEAVAARGVTPTVTKINSTEAIKTNSIKVFPNPARDILNIELGNTDEPTIVKIFSSNGELVKTIATGINDKYLLINISGLTNGLYAVNIITGKEMKSFTFIKM